MHEFDATERDQDANALRIVLIYATFAALWILLSDRLVGAFLSDPFHIMVASMLKGWLFVAITSLLLYGLIRRRGAKVGAGDTPMSRSGLLLLATLAIMVLAGAGIGHSFQRQREVQLGNLQSIAAAKARQISHWIADRQSDVELVRISRHVAENFQSWLRGGAGAEQNLKTHLDRILELQRFDAISLVDPASGRTWRSERAPQALAPSTRAALATAGATRQVVRTPSYRDAEGMHRLDLVAPLEFTATTPAMVVMHVNLDREFLALVRDWPYPLAGFEAQLLRANGGQIEFVAPSQATGHEEPAPTILPLEKSPLAAQALATASGEPAVVSGDDHRGAPSMGVARRIADTDWLLLIRLGEADLHAAAARDATWIALSSLMAMFIALTGFVLLRQRDRLDLMSSMGAAREEKLRALLLLDAIAEQSEDAIFAKDLDGRYLLFNRAAAGFVGMPAESVIGKDDHALFPADQAAKIQANDQRGISEARIVVSDEVLDTAFGPRVFHATKGPLHDSTGRVIGSFGVSRDVTDAVRAAEELRQRNEELERFNRASVGRELDMIELKRDVNRLSRELGRREPHALQFDGDGNASSKPGQPS
jgi:PAS domain S-box-containing protein